MAQYARSFDDAWKSEAYMKAYYERTGDYPKGLTVKYGEPYKTKNGRDCVDWIIKDGRREIARHMLMFIANGTKAVVCVDPKAVPLSPALKAIADKIADSACKKATGSKNDSNSQEDGIDHLDFE